MSTLADQVAIVTGSGRGIGRAIAEALLQEGANIVISDINEELCQTTAAEINKQAGRETALAVPCNVTDGASWP